MNFDTLKITLKIHKKVINTDPGLVHKGIYLWLSTYGQDRREIRPIVNEKTVIKC